MKLEFPFLSLLATQRMTGYDIKRWSEVEGKFLGLDKHPSQIYRELVRMESEGWIRHDVDARDNAPDAKVYQITDAGFERLDRWVRSPYEPDMKLHKPDFLVRLRAAGSLDLAVAQDLVERELNFREQQVRDNRGRPRPADHLERSDRPEIDVAALAFIADEIDRGGRDDIDRWIAWLTELRVAIMQRLDGAGSSRETS